MLAGCVFKAVISVGTDVRLHKVGITPALTEHWPDKLLAVATFYRTIYGVLSSWITARLARNHRWNAKRKESGMPTSHETWVTFRLAGSKQALILLPVFIDGRGPYSFLLDTGATSTVVSNELADALTLPLGEKQDGRGAGGKMTLVKSQVPSLTLGVEMLEGLPVSVTDLSFLGRAMGVQVDGALGHSFLRHFAILDLRCPT